MSQKGSWFYITIILVAGLHFSSCNDNEVTPTTIQDEAEIAQLTQFLEELIGVHQSLITYDKRLDNFIIRNEMTISKEQARLRLKLKSDAQSGRIKQKVFNLITSYDFIGDKKIFIENSVPSSWASSLRIAITEWNLVHGTKLAFREVTSSSVPNVRVSGIYSEGGFAVLTDLPNLGPPSSNQVMVINQFYTSTIPDNLKITYMVQALGYTVGLFNTDATNGIHIPGTPEQDPLSALNLTPQVWSGFSEGDITAVQLVWPYPQQQIYSIQNNSFFATQSSTGLKEKLGFPIWFGAEVMSSTSGYLFLVKNGELLKVSPRNIYEYTSLGSGWNGSEAMGAVGGFVYTVQGGELWKTNASNGSTTSLGGGWTGTEALTAGTIGSTPFVFAVQGGEFWKTNANTGASVSLGSGWSGTEAMTFGNGYVFAVHGDILYRVDPSSGSTIVIESSGWTGTEGMTFSGGNIYAVQGGTLWRTSPNGGSTSLGTGWSGTQVIAGVQ